MGVEDEARDEQGRWTTGGGGGAGGNKVSADGLRAFAGKPRRERVQREISSMQPSQINKELDQLSKDRDRINDKMIAAGRGNETFRETSAKSDPLAKEFNAVHDRMRSLHDEIGRRYGPGAPTRLPKGFGPIRGY
jgi:hypothetical protein